MSMRDKINNSPAGAVGLALVVLVCAAGAAWLLMGGNDKDPANQGLAFFDLATGQLVYQPLDAVAPVKLDSGNEAVEALVFACGECPDELTVENVVYLRRLHPRVQSQVKKAMESEDFDARAIASDNFWQIATIDGAKEGDWAQQGSDEALDIIENLARFCEGQDGRKVRCFPYK